MKPSLRNAVASVDARKAHLEAWARHFHASQLVLAEQNGTAQMLQESFAHYGYTGSTLRKAVVFYLGLVDYVGLPNSPYFRAPKQAATATSRRRVRPAPAATSRPEPMPPLAAPTVPRGETTVISIEDLATITVTVDALWMKLPVETITSMREAIVKLEALDTTGQQS